MQKFQITYGLGGDYKVHFSDVIEADSMNQAEEVAYNRSVDVFNTYRVFEEQCKHVEYNNDEEREMHYHAAIDGWCNFSVTQLS